MHQRQQTLFFNTKNGPFQLFKKVQMLHVHSVAESLYVHIKKLPIWRPRFDSHSLLDFKFKQLHRPLENNQTNFANSAYLVLVSLASNRIENVNITIDYSIKNFE